MCAALLFECATALAANPPSWRPEDPSRFRPASPREALEVVREQGSARRARAGAPRPERLAAQAAADTEGEWREWAPPSRAFHDLVYDSRRDRLIVLGGDRHYGGRRTVWQLPLAGPPRWAALEAAAAPPAAEHLAAAYDSLRDRIVAYLAIQDAPGAALRGEVWTLSLGGDPVWAPLATSGSPPARFEQSVALGGSGKRLFLVSTAPGFQPIEAWQLDLESGRWTAIHTQGPQSRNGFQPDVILDDRRERLVVSAPDGLWTLTLGEAPEWTRLHDHDLGDARLLYDRAGDRALVVDARGRIMADPLGGGTSPPTEPESLSDRTGFAAAWDSRRGRVAIHGGWHAQSYQTLSRTLARAPGAAWDDIGSWSGDARLWHAAVLDRARDQAVVYGGSWLSEALVVTRPLADPNAPVSAFEPAPGPRPRAFYAFSFDFDAARDRALLYGGQTADGSGELLDELWALSMSPAAWTRLVPAGQGPGRRYYHTTFMDPARDRLVVIGGHTADANPHGAWELRLSPALEWRPLALNGVSPSHIQRTFRDEATGEVWAWAPGAAEGPLWKLTPAEGALLATRVPMAGAPETADWIHFTPISLDPARRRLVVLEEDFGSRCRLSGYWNVALGASAVWTWNTVEPGPRPFDRLLQATLADPARDRVILYGGTDDNDHYFDDWWSLDFDRATPVLVSVMSAEFRDGIARLAWSAAGAGGDVTVERRRDGGPWTTVATARPDDRGRVTYLDASLEAGHRYSWRLLVPGDGGVMAMGETTLEVPGALPFAMRGPLRNPVTGPLEVAFTVDRPLEARIGLYDALGRRVLERRVTAAGPGTREMALAPAGGVPPGVYFVRLEDGTRASSARVVITR